MKRSEFVALVNDVMDEERKEALKRVDEMKSSSECGQDFIANLIAESYVQSAEIAAITTGKIIERLGLVSFD